jgi:EAL domain-containing protein (putative c-di-GMP-specific phosphodiesterase class I)
MSVLVVDDNPSNVALLKTLLEDEGLNRITTLTDSRDVEPTLSSMDPDLVLLDLHMPYIDGHALLQTITRFAAGSYLPVLVLTADSTSDARDRALGHGARDYLTKPFDTVEVALRVGNLLETRRLYTSLRRTVLASDAQVTEAELSARRARTLDVLRNRTITPFYQPVVNIETRVVVGHEALARFPLPHDHGPAGWFLDAASVGLGVELERLAATKSLEVLRNDPLGGFLAVNMSPAMILQLDDELFCDEGYCPRVVIELTEHVPIEDYAGLHRALSTMRDHGARVAADDLGSGYAGFRHLVLLSPDIIKLDISLVAGIHRSRSQRALTSALVAFARDVGASVIAEGIEEADELVVLRDLGVQWGQGYYLGRPAPLTSTPHLAVQARSAQVASRDAMRREVAS